MDNLHESELSTVKFIRGKGEYFGARADTVRQVRVDPSRTTETREIYSRPRLKKVLAPSASECIAA